LKTAGFLATLTLTFDRVILHTVVHHSLTSTYTPNFIEIEETFVDGRTYARTNRQTFETGFIRSTLSKSRPKYKLQQQQQQQIVCQSCEAKKENSPRQKMFL